MASLSPIQPVAFFLNLSSWSCNVASTINQICNALQRKSDKEDSRWAFWWKKNPFNHSTTPACSDFKLFLRICVFVAPNGVREVFHRSAGAQCRPKIGGFQFGRGGGKPQLQAQLQHSYVSQLRAAQLQQHSTVTCHSYRMGLHNL